MHYKNHQNSVCLYCRKIATLLKLFNFTNLFILSSKLYAHFVIKIKSSNVDWIVAFLHYDIMFIFDFISANFFSYKRVIKLNKVKKHNRCNFMQRNLEHILKNK